MRIITGFLFILNLAIWVVMSVVCWNLTGSTLGVPVTFGVIAFLIAWAISGEATLAPMDYLMQPEWDVFVTKFKWANQIGVYCAVAILVICIIFGWLNVRDFLGI